MVIGFLVWLLQGLIGLAVWAGVIYAAHLAVGGGA